MKTYISPRVRTIGLSTQTEVLIAGSQLKSIAIREDKIYDENSDDVDWATSGMRSSLWD